MTITYPLSLPDTRFASINLRIQSANQVSISPFSYARQVASLTGQMWLADVEVTKKIHSDYREWESFIFKLRGQFGTFLLGDPTKETASGSASTTPGTLVLDGSHNARDAVINIKTGLGATTGYLKSGDHIQLGSGSTARLHQVLNDVDLNSSGKADVDISPDLRTSYSDETSIIIDSPKGLFSLDDLVDLPKVPVIGSLAFSCSEVI